MLLSVTSRPGISTFGYNKNNKKVGKVLFFGIQLLPFLGIGSALGFNILLKSGKGFLFSSQHLSLFPHFLASFLTWFWSSRNLQSLYVRLEKAGELKTSFYLWEMKLVWLPADIPNLHRDNMSSQTLAPSPPASNIILSFWLTVSVLPTPPSFLPVWPALSGSRNIVGEITTASSRPGYSLLGQTLPHPAWREGALREDIL